MFPNYQKSPVQNTQNGKERKKKKEGSNVSKEAREGGKPLVLDINWGGEGKGEKPIEPGKERSRKFLPTAAEMLHHQPIFQTLCFIWLQGSHDSCKLMP